MVSPTQLPAWRRLQLLAQALNGQSLPELFRRDPSRFTRFSRTWRGHLFDFSKQLITEEVLQALLMLAQESGLHSEREALWAGQAINRTEGRAVLHVALRDQSGYPFSAVGASADGDIPGAIAAEFLRLKTFVAAVRGGDWRGYSGKAITDVVSLGIGGSHLGPQTVCEALADWADERLAVHFVSNVDGAQIQRTLQRLSPETTLFIVSSKTFNTRETMINAQTARGWLLAGGIDASAVAQHFAAVTAAPEKARAMGIAGDNIFTLWDWVGGRFSLWSAIGLPIALFLGFDVFDQLRGGAHAMDQHFLTSPDDQNLPLLMGLLGVWNSTFLKTPSLAILPYNERLKHLPAYLQQAEMESNGKSVHRDGTPVAFDTCPIVWGQLGIDGQHAFYQLLHQGTHAVAADFIGAVRASHELPDHHENLLANLLAQSQALMQGVDSAAITQDLQAKGLAGEALEALVPHKVHRGNRCSSTLLLEQLTPHSLGALIALYEHKIFVQGVIWNICSYDQWGVELGKQLANNVERHIRGDDDPAGLDASTRGLLAFCRGQQR